MTIYWAILFIPLLGLLVSKDRDISLVFWLLLFVIFSLFIGLRYEVGGDWGQYLWHYKNYSSAGLFAAFITLEPGYYLLNWFSGQIGGNIYFVNMICAFIFLYGAIAFCRTQPSPLLAFYMLVPYTIFVIVMGYTRQGVALGFIFWALAYYDKTRHSLVVPFLLIGLASTFHKSALIALPFILFLGHAEGKIIVKIFILLLIIPIIVLSQADSYLDRQWESYVEEAMVSTGGPIRVAMNLLPGLIFLLFRKQFKKYFTDEYLLYLLFSLWAVASMLLVFFASTAVDRISFYIIPLQIYVFSRVYFFLKDKFLRTTAVMFICMYYLVVWLVWSNFATHAKYWLPYQNVLFL